jgi:replication factor C subunit 3/5
MYKAYLSHDSSDDSDELNESKISINDNENEDCIDEQEYKKIKKKDKNKINRQKIDILASHNEIMDLIDEFKTSDDYEKEYTCLPWVEEFRPKKLKHVIDHEVHVSTLKKLVKKKKLPNLLLSGPPGTGKTSTIMACAKELYKDNYSLMVLNINASEERGIDVVRNKIKNFIMTKGIYTSDKQCMFKLVILDEADAMTEDAQSMLIKIMEKHIHNARFCLMCNYIKKIHLALQSRCTIFKFSPLKHEHMKNKILEISKKYDFEVTEDGIESLIQISNGDMRKVINTLQATNMAFSVVNRLNINKCIGYPFPEEIEYINKMLSEKNIKYCYENIDNIIKKNGYSLMDIVHELFNICIQNYIKNNGNTNIEKLILNLRNIESNLTMYQSENIQLAGVISAFKLN